MQAATGIYRPVYWLGGSPCAGKSTVAREIATHHGWDVYECDADYECHVAKADPLRQPTLYTVGRLRDDALWLRPVPQQIATEIALYQEEFAAILADVTALPGDRPLVVEGAALLPKLIALLLGQQRRGAWLVPTPTFQRQHYAQRDWSHEVVAHCSDPVQAFENWMARDIGFAEYIGRTAREYHLPLHTIDDTEPLSATIAWVKQQWCLA